MVDVFPCLGENSGHESFEFWRAGKSFWRTLHPPQSLTKPNINPQNMTKLPTHQLLQLKTIACCSFRMNYMFKNFEVQGLRWYCSPFYFIIFVSLFDFFFKSQFFFMFFSSEKVVWYCAPFNFWQECGISSSSSTTKEFLSVRLFTLVLLQQKP